MTGCIFLLGGRKYRADEKIKNLSKNTELLTVLNANRGVLALFIIFNHVLWINGIDKPPIAAVYGPLTFSAVAYFFFVSGYGMGLKKITGKKEHIVRLMKKLCWLLALDLIVVVFEQVIHALFFGDGGDLARYFILHTNWYIKELTILYVVYCLAGIISQKYYPAVTGLLCVAVWILLCFMVKDPTWSNSMLGFPAGALLASGYNTWIKRIVDNKKMLFGTAVLSFVVLILHGERHLFPGLLSSLIENMLGGVFILVMTLVSVNVKISANRIAKWLNRHSLELYMTQFIWLRISKAVIPDVMASLLFSVGMTAVSAILLRPLSVKLKQLLYDGAKKKGT